jgi:hypothetical protein
LKCDDAFKRPKVRNQRQRIALVPLSKVHLVGESLRLDVQVDLGHGDLDDIGDSC